MSRETWKSTYESLGLTQTQMRDLRRKEGAPKNPVLSEWQDFIRRSQGGGDDAAGKLPGRCPYDQLVDDNVITWQAARVREQVIGERLANEKRQAEIDVARGKLITRAQAKDAMIKQRDELLMHIDQLPQLLVNEMKDLSPSAKSDIRVKLTSLIGALKVRAKNG